MRKVESGGVLCWRDHLIMVKESFLQAKGCEKVTQRSCSKALRSRPYQKFAFRRSRLARKKGETVASSNAASAERGKNPGRGASTGKLSSPEGEDRISPLSLVPRANVEREARTWEKISRPDGRQASSVGGFPKGFSVFRGGKLSGCRSGVPGTFRPKDNRGEEKHVNRR